MKTIKKSILCFMLVLAACAKPLPHFGTLPPFSLQSQEGQAITLDSLKGHVWVANFIYTGCGATCPVQTQRLSQLQKRVADETVKFVSITVDPETDTVARLKEYSAKYQADSRRWYFLTGDTKAIEDMATKGFKLSVSKESATTIFHSDRFVLIDSSGDIRGYFESQEVGNVSLIEAIQKVSKEK